MSNKRDSAIYCAMCRKEVPLSLDGIRHNYVEVCAVQICPDLGWYGMSARVRTQFSLCPKCYLNYAEKMRELINLQLKDDHIVKNLTKKEKEK